MERLFFVFAVAGLAISGFLTSLRAYVWHDYAFYTDVEEIPDQAAEFEARYLPFLVSEEEE